MRVGEAGLNLLPPSCRCIPALLTLKVLQQSVIGDGDKPFWGSNDALPGHLYAACRQRR